MTVLSIPGTEINSTLRSMRSAIRPLWTRCYGLRRASVKRSATQSISSWLITSGGASRTVLPGVLGQHATPGQA